MSSVPNTTNQCSALKHYVTIKQLYRGMLETAGSLCFQVFCMESKCRRTLLSALTARFQSPLAPSISRGRHGCASPARGVSLLGADLWVYRLLWNFFWRCICHQQQPAAVSLSLSASLGRSCPSPPSACCAPEWNKRDRKCRDEKE